MTPASLEAPAVRPVEIMPVAYQGRELLLVRDPMGVIEGMVALPPDPLVLVILQMADGQTPLEEMARVAREQTGLIVTTDKIRNVVRELDAAGLFFSENFLRLWEQRRESYRKLPARACTVFQSDDRLLLIKELGDELRRHTTAKNSPPGKLSLPNGNVRAVLSPHIDFGRGGPTYAWAYKAIAEHTRARTFIVLGTLHQPSTHPFIATGKPHETPFGTVEIDTELLGEIEKEFGGELWRDEYLHAIEHTVELQAVYLKHVLKDRPFKIAPFLVGSFESYLYEEPACQPSDDPEVARFIGALRRVLERHGDAVVLIGGVDLAHCGPEFGDPELNTAEVQAGIERQDKEALAAISAVDPKRFFESFRPTMNSRKVCSIAAIYCVLAAMEGSHEGTVLAYDQANSPDRSCMVTFASAAFTPKGRRIVLEG